MQQVFFQETEFLNSVIDYDHKIETENLCLDIAYGTDKTFLLVVNFDCFNIKNIMKEINCVSIFLLIILVMMIVSILMPRCSIKPELKYI